MKIALLSAQRRLHAKVSVERTAPLSSHAGDTAQAQNGKEQPQRGHKIRIMVEALHPTMLTCGNLRAWLRLQAPRYLRHYMFRAPTRTGERPISTGVSARCLLLCPSSVSCQLTTTTLTSQLQICAALVAAGQQLQSQLRLHWPLR